MAAKPPNFVRITRRFDASPERVFDAWLDPKIARKWLFTLPEGEAYTAELDTRIGGRWTITERRGGVDYTGVGEYLEIDRPRRLVFTFAMPQFSPDINRIIVEIEPEETGCILTLVQEGLPEGYEDATINGWGKMFTALAAALAS
jgi:uncharacterized protein YndB with AHSA1/START domain